MNPKSSSALCVVPLLSACAGLAIAAAAAQASEGPGPIEVPAPKAETAAPPGPKLPVLRWGVLPYLDWATVENDYRPLETYLMQAAGVKLELVLSRDYGTLVDMLAAGDVDVASLSAALYLKARARLGEKIDVVGHTVTRETRSYHGVFVTRRDSGIRTLTEAKGRSIAWVDKDSSSGYVFPRMLMTALGLDPEKHFGEQHWAGSHDKAVEMVLGKKVDVAATWDALWKSGDVEVPRKLRVLGRSKGIPPDALVVRSKLDKATRSRVVKALLDVRQQPPAKAELLMKRLRIRGWDPGSDADYETLRTELQNAGIL